MILVVGGIASGKRTYVRSLGYEEEQMSTKPSSDAPVLIGLEETLRTAPLDRKAFEQVAHKDVVVCCEVGSGVVPMDKDERAWRELVGRTSAQLAQRAHKVVRLVCLSSVCCACHHATCERLWPRPSTLPTGLISST